MLWVLKFRVLLPTPTSSRAVPNTTYMQKAGGKTPSICRKKKWSWIKRGMVKDKYLRKNLHDIIEDLQGLEIFNFDNLPYHHIPLSVLATTSYLRCLLYCRYCCLIYFRIRKPLKCMLTQVFTSRHRLSRTYHGSSGSKTNFG